MAVSALAREARMLVADGKGLLAIDESTATCNMRLAAAGITPSLAARRAWRELLITTPDLASCISGVILYDETFRQANDDGVSFLRVLADAGLIPGIKVDLGAQPLAGHPGGKVTEGLDGLRERLLEYRDLGARFAKWRAVLQPDRPQHNPACVAANAHALARYAALCQEVGLVPIVEPEVLMDGAHDLERCATVTGEVLHAVFEQLYQQGVALDGVILKVNMVLPGLSCPQQATLEDVVDSTLECLRASVPAAIPGVAFLSGGQPAALATARLNALQLRLSRRAEPWALTFSFGRALQEPALSLWRGEPGQVERAQQALLHRARCNLAALAGRYHADQDPP